MTVFALAGGLTASGELAVASLNPIISDLAKQVGGERVKVIELMKAGENPHSYTPNPEQLREAHKADIILAAGKGLETYLADIRGNLGQNQQILEVGNTIPSLAGVPCDSCAFDHAHGATDPHWWHSIANIKRAARIISASFSKLSPEDRSYFEKRTRSYCQSMDQLTSWAKKEIYKIPRRDRILTTAHASFGYFCHDFGFTAVPIQGLSTESTPGPNQLAAVIKSIRELKIKAVFPEKAVNPELLKTVINETGVKIGGYLLAGSPEPENPTCEAMLRHNVTTIVNALAPEKE